MTGPEWGLRGKRAVVTGGSRGVGRAVALLLARLGASVGIAYHTRGDVAEEAAARCREFGVEAWAEGGDLSTEAGVERLFRRVDREFEGLDLFVGNHGIWPHRDVPLAEMTAGQWRRTLAVNLDSIFLTSREAARRVERGGRLVLVGSTAGQRGEAYHGDYAASKGAIVSLVKGLCVELAPRDVTVNVVAPGWVDTEMAAPALEGERGQRIRREIPLGRIASPEDVAGPIVFLCSELARHVTGEVLNVNGGSVLAG